ncbi:MAG: HEPN domain-containing protein [Deltaproteobacteria bacterium]|nr:HEPN domain-containing protein [Deltaproteobacteria bacterium]
MTKDEIMDYWINSSEIDFLAMETLLNNGHYVWSLFIGHLVIEKLLKAYYVKNVDTDMPYLHDLTKIAEKGNLVLSEKQKDFLDEVTTFNIKSRYPDYKERFYKKATKEFTENYIFKIKEFRKWLIEKIKN